MTGQKISSPSVCYKWSLDSTPIESPLTINKLPGRWTGLTKARKIETNGVSVGNLVSRLDRQIVLSFTLRKVNAAAVNKLRACTRTRCREVLSLSLSLSLCLWSRVEKSAGLETRLIVNCRLRKRRSWYRGSFWKKNEIGEIFQARSHKRSASEKIHGSLRLDVNLYRRFRSVRNEIWNYLWRAGSSRAWKLQLGNLSLDR